MRSKEQSLYDSVLDCRDFVGVSMALIRRLGPVRAVFLAAMMKKEDGLTSKGKLPEDGSFYFLMSEIKEKIGFSLDRIASCVKALKDLGLITVKKREAPPRSYYTIQREKVLTLVKVGQSPTRRLEKSNIQTQENPEFILNHSRSNDSQAMTELLQSSSRDAGASHPPYEKQFRTGPEKKREAQELRPEIRELMLEVLPIGEFHNRPPEEGKPAAQLYLDVQKFLAFLPDSRAFAHEYELDGEWMKRYGIDLEWFRGRAVEPLVRWAAKRFALMRREGYEPEKKRALTPYVQQFFYNKPQRKSWFLYCCFNEPTQVRGHGREIDLTEKERALLLRHKRPDWEEREYMVKAKNLLAWHREHLEDLRVFNYHVMDTAQQWDEHFATIGDLLRTVDEFAETWKGWTLGNFGCGNKTWPRFLEWCRRTYKVKLDPTPERVAEAYALQKKHEEDARDLEKDLGRENENLAELAERTRREFLGQDVDCAAREPREE